MSDKAGCRVCGRSERRVGAGPYRGESVPVKVALDKDGVCQWCRSRYRDDPTFLRWVRR